MSEHAEQYEYLMTGVCPRCAAPIYAKRALNVRVAVPSAKGSGRVRVVTLPQGATSAHFTCTCSEDALLPSDRR